MRVHHIAITAKNSEKTAEFFKKNLGFVEVDRFTKPGWDGDAVVLQLGDVRLEIFQFQSSIDKKDDFSNLKVIGFKHIGIQVDSVKDMHALLKSKGVDIDEPVKGTTCAWFCFLRDPDGIPIELYEPN